MKKTNLKKVNIKDARKIYKGYKVEKTSISTKKEPITAVDVSEDEHIAIMFSDETIGIYDKQMNYASAYKFDTEGEFSGILWKGNNLLLFKARSDYGVEIDAEGELVNVYKEDPVYDDVLWDEYVLSKKRVVNNNKYIITNNKTKPSIIDKVKGINCSF
ncbi:MAG: hypothetical protein VB031_09360 [Eubacteriaceae bacterium]|nr:hypothetical protein [Eubacteriaceae bacterium]